MSFTLDPMLLAFWGDPPGYHHQPRRGVPGRLLARFNAWFDRLSDGYGSVIAWALHHWRWMATFAVAGLVGALALQAMVGGSSFLPSSDNDTFAVEVRTPAGRAWPTHARRWKRVAALARSIPGGQDLPTPVA